MLRDTPTMLEDAIDRAVTAAQKHPKTCTAILCEGKDFERVAAMLHSVCSAHLEHVQKAHIKLGRVELTNASQVFLVRGGNPARFRGLALKHLLVVDHADPEVLNAAEYALRGTGTVEHALL